MITPREVLMRDRRVRPTGQTTGQPENTIALARERAKQGVGWEDLKAEFGLPEKIARIIVFGKGRKP